MAPTTKASSFLAESLATLSKSVHEAFADVEKQSRLEVARAVADATKARRERDEAVDKLHTLEIEESLATQELVKIRATLVQAELTIAHQAETIMQLHREITQWKGQSQNWQEHFLRVEQQRCALSTRNEDLAEQLLQTRSVITSTPYTPKPNYTDVNPDSAIPSSSVTTRASSSKAPPAYKSVAPISSGEDGPATISANKPQRSTRPAPSKQTAKTPKSQASTSKGKNQKAALRAPATQKHVSPEASPRQPTPPRQTFIRRVQAVIQVPIKDEEEDANALFTPSDDDEGPRSRQAIAAWSANTSASIGRKRPRIEDDDHDELELSYGEDNDESGNYIDEEGLEEAQSEEEDELMLRAEDHRIPHPQPKAAATRTKTPAKKAPTIASSPKKRKLVANANLDEKHEKPLPKNRRR